MSAQGTVEGGTMVDTGIWASYHLLLKTTWVTKRASPYIHNLIHSNLGRQRRWQTPLYQHMGNEDWSRGLSIWGMQGVAWALSTLKKCTAWELWVKFYLGQNEPYSLGDSISNSSEKMLERGRGEGQHICDFGEVGVHVIKHRFLQKVSASLMKLSLMFSFPPLFSNSLKSFIIEIHIFQFLWASLVAQMTKSLPEMQEGNGNPLQYSCLENPMDGEAWWATVHGLTKSRTQLSD